jgi:glycerophosphoryl diester phosphodiesterase
MTPEYQAFLKVGIDAVFSDFTDTAVKQEEINFR